MTLGRSQLNFGEVTPSLPPSPFPVSASWPLEKLVRQLPFHNTVRLVSRPNCPSHQVRIDSLHSVPATYITFVTVTAGASTGEHGARPGAQP